jgi:D-3-phosphoglycerate dehydrogenase
MSYNILLTSTSFQDTPGAHQELLAKQGFNVYSLRGPLKEEVLLDIIDQYDGIICGDDEITRAVIAKGVSGKLRIISKYGIGLDKVDIAAANEFNMPVTNCPGVNQVTVAEHVFALLLTYIKNIIPEHEIVQKQQWVRYIGNELNGKTLGVLGTGNVGKEVIKRALAFGMKVIAFDKFQDKYFAEQYNVSYFNSALDVIAVSDMLTLNLSLNEETNNIISHSSLQIMKKGIILVNTARAGLVESSAILEGIDRGIIGGYLTDVLEEEPILPNHPFLGNNKIIVTPHIGSRTYENVVNQGTMAVNNLLKHISL